MSKSDDNPYDIDLSGTENYDYDEWLEFFRRLGPKKITEGVDWLFENMQSSDGYAAAKRWLEIFAEPSRMEKLYKGRLDRQQEENIMEVAIGDDDEAFYIALIQKNTTQLNSSSVSQQEVARLSQNINIFRKELREIRSRKPKAGSTLEKVLAAANAGPKKPKVTPVKRKKAAPKAAGASRKKKTTTLSSKGKK